MQSWLSIQNYGGGAAYSQIYEILIANDLIPKIIFLIATLTSKKIERFSGKNKYKIEYSKIPSMRPTTHDASSILVSKTPEKY